MIDWLRAAGNLRTGTQPAANPEIEIAGRILPIELRRMKRATRLTLRLAPDGTAVRITLPDWCATREALAFAHKRAHWLEQQLAKVPPALGPLETGTVLYRGQELAIDWAQEHPRKVTLGDGGVRLGGTRDTLPRRLGRWLETEALRHFEEDAARFCTVAGLPEPAVRLTRAKRRWGSCSSEGVLRLNWRLIQAPDPVRRSVVAHEVAHLVHFDHSPAFHALLGQLYDDDLDAANAWLSANGRTLYAAFG